MNKTPNGLDDRVYEAIMRNIPHHGSVAYDELVAKTAASLGNSHPEEKIRETIERLLDRFILLEDGKGNIILNE
ncbi:MAG: hypothetical protein HYT62_02615 [Candidatus Yanofskybacteria bacterium]|nr:hypothetical protein [Candidatus Yanofskybacteria bacterium]